MLQKASQDLGMPGHVGGEHGGVEVRLGYRADCLKGDRAATRCGSVHLQESEAEAERSSSRKTPRSFRPVWANRETLSQTLN